MTTIRLHAYRGTNDGSASCDFRGANFIGHAQGDEHKTLLEKDVDDASPLVADVLQIGPQVNKILAGLYEGIEAGQIEAALGGAYIGLRIGVWDKIAPDGS